MSKIREPSPLADMSAPASMTAACSYMAYHAAQAARYSVQLEDRFHNRHGDDILRAAALMDLERSIANLQVALAYYKENNHGS